MTTLLFLDDLMLTHRRDVVRRLGKPQWVPEGTLDEVLCDGTWNRPTIFPSPEGGYRALYNGVTYRDGTRVPLGLMVADSVDGIAWRRPDLSARSAVSDRILPNQVYPMHYGGPAYYDVNEPDPARRLKLLHSTGAVEPGKTALFLSVSPDGITWQRERIWGDRPLDAPISMFRNSRDGRYVISNRPMKHDRRVSFISTFDFEQFSEPQIVLSPDAEDPALSEFYGMTVVAYEGYYIGLLLMFHVQADERHKRHGYVDGWLTYSLDGWHFNRLFHRPFVTRTERGRPGSGGIYPSCIVRVSDDTLHLYSAGSRAGHFHLPEPLDSAILLHTLRRDGFAYLEPTGLVGSVTTRPLRFHGSGLTLNARAPHGQVRVRLIDLDGAPVPGFDFADSIAFVGDEVCHRPRWRNAGKDLAGMEVHLEIEVTNGELFALRGDFTVAIGYSSWSG